MFPGLLKLPCVLPEYSVETKIKNSFCSVYVLFCRTGDITELGVHAIVHSTNERLSEKSIVSEKIYSKAGPKLVEEIRNNIKSE